MIIFFSDQCSLNTDCLNDQECQNPNCIDLECVDGNGNNYCESSAECRIDDHELECFCDSGLVAKQGTGGANEDDETLECGKYAPEVCGTNFLNPVPNPRPRLMKTQKRYRIRDRDS